MKALHRQAFSVIELLVVLAIFGFLLALLLPAVRKVRQAQGRVEAMNNLKQLGLACHNYHDAFNHFPSGNDKNSFSAAAYILPFIEQEQVYKLIDFKKSIADDANANARKVQIKTYLSPGDPITQAKSAWGATNYLFNAGSKPSLDDNDGICFQDSKITFAQILDGTSNTIMIGETLKGDDKTKATSVQRQYVVLKGRDVLEKLNDKSGLKEWKANRNIRGDRCASWMDGRFLQGTFTATRALNDPNPDVMVDGGFGGLSSLRSLTNGVNCTFCDGSVHFVKAKIDPKVWKLLCSRNDGQVIPNNDDF